MPEEFARRLARQLKEDHTDAEVVVELEDRQFAERVAYWLRHLDCAVVVHPEKPCRLTVRRLETHEKAPVNRGHDC